MDALASSSKKPVVAKLNISAIKGEKGTGYEKFDGRGPFECGNCNYYRASDSSCGQKDMMKFSKQPRLRNSRVVVEERGCCEYVERKDSEKEESEK